MTEADGKEYVIVAGGYSSWVTVEQSVEYLDDFGGVFEPGTDRPHTDGNAEAQLVTNPATGEVILLGGIDNDGDILGSINKLSSVNGQ